MKFNKQNEKFFTCPEWKEKSLHVSHNCQIPLINTGENKPFLSDEKEDYTIFCGGIAAMCFNCGVEADDNGGDSEILGDFLKSDKFANYALSYPSSSK